MPLFWCVVGQIVFGLGKRWATCSSGIWDAIVLGNLARISVLSFKSHSVRHQTRFSCSFLLTEIRLIARQMFGQMSCLTGASFASVRLVFSLLGLVNIRIDIQSPDQSEGVDPLVLSSYLSYSSSRAESALALFDAGKPPVSSSNSPDCPLQSRDSGFCCWSLGFVCSLLGARAAQMLHDNILC